MSNASERGPDEAATVYELGELADSVDPGEVPYDRLIAGGRRRLRRRRLATAGAAAALVVAVGAVGTVIGAPVRGSGAPVGAAASASGTAVPTTPVPGGRDPYDPIRVKINDGASNGRTWQAWVALWPATPTKEAAGKQARLIWEARHAANPQLPQPTDAEAEQGWIPGQDLANVYVTLDGKRQADDFVCPVPSPAESGYTVSLPGVLGIKGSKMGDSPAVIVSVPFKATRVVVDWATGGSTEATTVVVQEYQTRWAALAKKADADVKTITYYDKDGAVLGGTGTGYVRTP
ncbi:hypothetical protein ACPC54_05420 [Kitasatospora sp. NPDC094028]